MFTSTIVFHPPEGIDQTNSSPARLTHCEQE
jgi:hypothetical protein